MNYTADKPSCGESLAVEPLNLLLEDLASYLCRFIRFSSDDHALVLATWVLHTWAFEASHATPYILITSPEKKSGKTRLLDVLETLVPEPMRASNISAAALFQSMPAAQGADGAWNVKDAPTVLLDEIDTIFGPFKGSEATEALRGVLNSGYKRGGLVRRGSKDGTPRIYYTYVPKALAGIDNGALPDTLRDRCLPIELRRRRADEAVDRFVARKAAPEAASLRERCSAVARANLALLVDAEPLLPEALDDRAAEVAEPLLAIADLAGCGWPEHVRGALLRLRVEDPEQDSLGVRLLHDLHEVFGERKHVFTEDLCTRLRNLDLAPWAAFGKDGIDARGLAKLLRPFGIKPKQIDGIDGKQRRGYRRSDFGDAWSRYVSPPAGADAGRVSAPRTTNPWLSRADSECHLTVAETADLTDNFGSIACILTDLTDLTDSAGRTASQDVESSSPAAPSDQVSVARQSDGSADETATTDTSDTLEWVFDEHNDIPQKKILRAWRTTDSSPN